MRWIRGRIVFFLLAAITAAFSINTIKDASELKDMFSMVSVRFAEEGVTEKALNEAMMSNSEKPELRDMEATAWKRIAEAEINNTDLRRSRTVSIITTGGNMAQTIPMTLLQGNYVYPGDKKGCVIDKDTAYSLFGTEHAVSNIVNYNKKNYVIRGIVKTDERVFLIQGENERIAYNNLEFIYSDKERGEALTREFLLLNGMDNYVMIDGYFFGRLIHSLLTLPVWLFLLLAGYRIIMYYRGLKGSINKKTYLLCGGILVLTLTGYGLLLYQFTGNPLYIPEKLIPTKWSDFDYWLKQYQILRDQIRQIRYLPPNPRDILLMDELTKLSLNITVMVILYGYMLHFTGHYGKYTGSELHQQMKYNPFKNNRLNKASTK